jgi:hypothetical protein
MTQQSRTPAGLDHIGDAHELHSVRLMPSSEAGA